MRHMYKKGYYTEYPLSSDPAYVLVERLAGKLTGFIIGCANQAAAIHMESERFFQGQTFERFTIEDFHRLPDRVPGVRVLKSAPMPQKSFQRFQGLKRKTQKS